MQYIVQDLNILLKGLEKFLFYNINNGNNINVNFIGAGSVSEIKELITEKLNFKNVLITNKIERKKAIEIGKKSHILIYAGWKNYKGVYSGKIFEYLGLKNNILIAPKDNGVIDNLLKETKAGISVNTSEEVFYYLQNNYQHWLEYKNIKYYGIPEKINCYTRENQNKKILNFILQTNSEI
jgi:hypothetical protein